MNISRNFLGAFTTTSSLSVSISLGPSPVSPPVVVVVSLQDEVGETQCQLSLPLAWTDGEVLLGLGQCGELCPGEWSLQGEIQFDHFNRPELYFSHMT